MEECEITVFTPVYNRAREIKKLYQSLAEQTNHNFKWMIVDDGSNDQIEDVISNFINEKKVNIEFYKKSNGGKHTAINYGVNRIKTKFTYLVDSDDWLLPHAIQMLYDYSDKYKNLSENICGFNFLRQFPNGEINGELFPEEEMRGSYIDVRINKHITGDKTTMFFTKCLKEYTFPEYEGEKFLGEDVVWIDMANKYEMIYINKPIYVGQYLTTGLTQNRREHNIKSPKGSSYRGTILMNEKCNLKTRIKGAMSYIIYGKFDNRKNLKIIKDSKYKFLVIVFLIPAQMLYLWWNFKYKKNKGGI